jgi:HK97 family phage prohead protease
MTTIRKDAAPMTRAYSLIEFKAVDEEKRIITGLATTPSVDRVGDVVDPKGAKYQLPVPLLLGHDSSQPIGNVTKATITKNGIEITAQIAKTDEAGTLKDRLDEAWQSIKLGLIRGLSIGFRSIDSERIEGTFGVRFTKWEWLELSAVVVPANSDASIQTIKQFDSPRTAEHRIVRLTPPGETGQRVVRLTSP